MSAKQTVTKTKKVATKKAPRVAANKAKTTAKPSAKKAITRRPDSNQPPSTGHIDSITNDVLYLIQQLEGCAANLRALDRQRHNGVGLKRLGFIEAAFRISTKFPQYFPHWLSTQKFQSDLDLFNSIRSLVEVCRSLEEKAWNINVESADMIYTDALEYYSQVQDAAERRIDSAESIYAELHAFFRTGKRRNENGEEIETEKKQLRDAKGIIKGTKQGIFKAENIKPRLTGGKHEVIDETFRDTASFKETEEGELNE